MNGTRQMLGVNSVHVPYLHPGTRFSDGDGSSNEVQRTMLELINQLDGFDPRGNIKVLMATNRYVLVWHIMLQLCVTYPYVTRQTGHAGSSPDEAWQNGQKG